MMCKAARWTFLVLMAALMCQSALSQTAGKITEVRVYQGQALVTRALEFEAKAGPQEVLVSELPELIVSDSLYAVGSEGVDIRAVRFRATATTEAPRPEVRALDDKIKKQQQDERRIASELGVLEARGKFLDSLEGFAAQKADAELRRGSLQPEALQATAKFIFDQRDEIAKKTLKLEGNKDALEETLTMLQRQRAELAGGEGKTQREAVVFVDAKKAGAAGLQLSYLVNGVGWSPAYSARLNDKRDRMALEYHAVVTQMSGEDWPEVQLTLSTSHPKMLAAAPILSPLRISLVASGKAAAIAGVQVYTEKQREFQQAIRGPQRAFGAAGPRGDRGDKGPVGPPGRQGMPSANEQFLAANVFAARLQNVELTAPDEVVRLSRAMGISTTEGLAVDYPIPGPISIQSRKDQQMFHIANLDLEADFNYVAVPLLTDYVYQCVECVNTSDYPLLAGPYNAYVAGAFSGRGDLSLVARGQGLDIGFGTETQLRVSRELEEKTTTTRGGNKIVQYTYRLRLHNYMDKAVKVRLWDRLPQAPNNQVTVTLSEPDPPLSEDPLYLATQRPRGLLRWDVEVPAKASGAKAHSFTYQFQIEFDKNFDIGELPANVAEAMEQEIRVLKQMRSGARKQ